MREDRRHVLNQFIYIFKVGLQKFKSAKGTTVSM